MKAPIKEGGRIMDIADVKPGDTVTVSCAHEATVTGPVRKVAGLLWVGDHHLNDVDDEILDHQTPGPRLREEYPVGACGGKFQGCYSLDPHRHGFNCSKSCVCKGIGAETEPLDYDDDPECDWGYCSREAVAKRRRRTDVAPETGDCVWVSVCAWHAGFDEHPWSSQNHEDRLIAASIVRAYNRLTTELPLRDVVQVVRDIRAELRAES
jgi:hypothetical protein